MRKSILMLSVQGLLFLVLLVSVLSPRQAVANVSFSYSDFSSTAGLTLNGNAAQAGNVLRLVPSTESQSGTAYRTIAVPLDATTGFSTSFEFLVTSDPSSGLGVTDGFTFLLQNDSAGASALGAAGQGSGYAGLSPSVAVLFRGRGPSFIGVVTNGVDPLPSLPPGSVPVTEGAFYDKNQYAWIDYNPSTTLLSVYLGDSSVKPGSAIMSTTVDVFGTLGPQAYVGFSAGNGGAYGSQDIKNWSFNPPTIPAPGAVLLGSIGVALEKNTVETTANRNIIGCELHKLQNSQPFFLSATKPNI